MAKGSGPDQGLRGRRLVQFRLNGFLIRIWAWQIGFRDYWDLSSCAWFKNRAQVRFVKKAK